MRNKEKLHEWIDRYNNNELSGGELVLFLDMLNKDGRLREEVWLDKELNAVLKQQDILDLQNKIRNICFKNRSKGSNTAGILLMAASLLVLLSLEVMIYYLFHPSNKTGKTEIAQKQKVSAESQWDHNKNKLLLPGSYLTFTRDQPGLPNDPLEISNACDLLALYQPNSALENLIGTTHRSGSFKMLRPTVPASFTKKSIVWFSWRMENPAETSLIVENNNGLTVYESDSNNNQSVFMKASFLGPGLFYYKIMQKDEVLFFGKFIVH